MAVAYKLGVSDFKCEGCCPHINQILKGIRDLQTIIGFWTPNPPLLTPRRLAGATTATGTTATSKGLLLQVYLGLLDANNSRLNKGQLRSVKVFNIKAVQPALKYLRLFVPC